MCVRWFVVCSGESCESRFSYNWSQTLGLTKLYEVFGDKVYRSARVRPRPDSDPGQTKIRVYFYSSAKNHLSQNKKDKQIGKPKKEQMKWRVTIDKQWCYGHRQIQTKVQTALKKEREYSIAYDEVVKSHFTIRIFA